MEKLEEKDNIDKKRPLFLPLIMVVLVTTVVIGYPVLNYYQSRIDQKNQEIENLQDQIDSITDRINKTQVTIDELSE